MTTFTTNAQSETRQNLTIASLGMKVWRMKNETSLGENPMYDVCVFHSQEVTTARFF